MSDDMFPVADFSKFRDYDKLWRYMRNHPALKGKDFPETSERQAWTASFDRFHHGFYGVLLSAKLRFSKTPNGPFFDLQLQPLKVEMSHRLGRRFGNDRFVELLLPRLYGSRLPPLLKQADNEGCGDACRDVIVEWLTRDLHLFLGVKWGAFFLRGIRKRKTIDPLKSEDIDNAPKSSVYLFATDGLGFVETGTVPLRDEPPYRHTKMAVYKLLNWLIPLHQNKNQKSLKLFSRIALGKKEMSCRKLCYLLMWYVGLSKTWKTVELDASQIIYPHDRISGDGKEVMNDGCGRLSRKMAMDVANCLGLTYVPSGFQGRIGSAKGLWIVDVDDCTDYRWIETYPSQIKWDNSGNLDPDHRTFEVCGWVKPLRAAALNLQFLPILENRGRDRPAMRGAISKLLVDGLTFEIDKQRAAMESPQLFRKWVRENSGIEDRLKYGRVSYKGGLPDSLEEQLNMLLDAGFDPQGLRFLKELAWRACTNKCNLLKNKMNITVGRSTYAYMAVDFTGTLEPDEVHLGFSANFKDEMSGFNEVLLDGMDILVARSPAHYVSDVQKVRAVWKRELKSLKDVIVFSSRGNYPLAKKLSGGDYDGDIAWVCFEPTIVGDFVNAEPPKCPNLLELNYITQDGNTFSNLTDDCTEPVLPFLEDSFRFNLKENLLGIVTSYKDDYCYTANTVDNYESVFLSTLLSDLVDQHKQGYSFSSDAWKKVKTEVIKVKTQQPKYKQDELRGIRNNRHIIDHLKFNVAYQTVENTLTKLHNSLRKAESSDRDVVKLGLLAQEKAKTSHDWANLLDTLREDIAKVKNEWARLFVKNKKDIQLVDDYFNSVVTNLHKEWQSISPLASSPLAQALPLDCLLDTDYSTWSLLKASLGFGEQKSGNFIWWMAGKQLAYLKASFSGEGAGGFAVVTPEMYAMLRPDSTFVKLMHSEEHEPRFWEAKAESVVPDEEELEE
jgi:hypothetical protein